MSRGLLLGVAIFVALLGIALVGSDSQALAGHGCGGCYGVVACDGAIACGGPVACGGVPVACCGAPVACGGPVMVARPVRRPLCAGGLFRHRRVVDCGCVGYAPVADCCGAVVVSKGAIQKGAVQKDGPVQKEGPVQKGGAAQKEAAQKVTATAAPFVFYQMSYRR